MLEGKNCVGRTVPFYGMSLHNYFVNLINYNSVIVTYKHILKYLLVTSHHIPDIPKWWRNHLPDLCELYCTQSIANQFISKMFHIGMNITINKSVNQLHINEGPISNASFIPCCHTFSLLSWSCGMYHLTFVCGNEMYLTLTLSWSMRCLAAGADEIMTDT